ncbi:MAG: hypothetical protein OXE80_10560 [Gammaproteobacteria bacterium]|nr:hypothetical protein [Gammaproteobacteria bacterium]
MLAGDDKRRSAIGDLLDAGLETEAFPRCDTDAQVREIVNRLQLLPLDDMRGRLVVAGVTGHTVAHPEAEIDQPCETCMYYLVHRKYCELPELDIPVEPHWSCRLWRI